MPQQTKWPFLAGLEDCSECKLYPFIYAYYFVTIVIMWLILRQKMSCFSHQSFLGGGVRGGGSWGSSTVVDYAMRGGGAGKKTHQIIGRTSKKCKGKHLK